MFVWPFGLGVRLFADPLHVRRGSSQQQSDWSPRQPSDVDLDVYKRQVKNHMTSIFRKLGVSDRTEAAIVALRRGWIRLQDTGKLSEESL